MANIELREGTNVVEVVGVVKEHNLKAGKGENGKYINGNLVVKAGEFTEIKVKVMVNEKNKKGEVKKGYETLMKFIEKDYKTMADGVSEGEATKVSIWGNKGFTPKLKEDIFAVEGKAKTSINIDLGFGNVAVKENLTPEDYKATYDLEMFVTDVVEENDKEDEPTGRYIVKGIVPCYGGKVFPIEIVAGVIDDEDGEINFGEVINDEVSEGMTLNIWGDINHAKIIEEVKKGGGLGRAKVEKKTTYIHEFVAVGAEIVDDEEKEFDEELIQKAMVERENTKREKEEEAENENKKGKGLQSKKEQDGKRQRPKF